MKISARAAGCSGNSKDCDQRKKRKSGELQKPCASADPPTIQHGEKRGNHEAENNVRQIDRVTAQSIQLHGAEAQGKIIGQAQFTSECGHWVEEPSRKTAARTPIVSSELVSQGKLHDARLCEQPGVIPE